MLALTLPSTLAFDNGISSLSHEQKEAAFNSLSPVDTSGFKYDENGLAYFEKTEGVTFDDDDMMEAEH